MSRVRQQLALINGRPARGLATAAVAALLLYGGAARAVDACGDGVCGPTETPQTCFMDCATVTISVQVKGDLVVKPPPGPLLCSATGSSSAAWPLDALLASQGQCGFKWTYGETLAPGAADTGATVAGLLTIRGGKPAGNACGSGGECWETNFCDGACCRNPDFDNHDPCVGECNHCLSNADSANPTGVDDTDGACVPRPSTTVCRGKVPRSAGQYGVAQTADCDNEEKCPAALNVSGQEVSGLAAVGIGDWSSRSCPNDSVVTDTTLVCRPSVPAGDGTSCDVADKCTGTSPYCPDGIKSATDVCRAAVAGGCDLPEHCSGASITCPDDKVTAGPGRVVCNYVNGATCSGTTATCPSTPSGNVQGFDSSVCM